MSRVENLCKRYNHTRVLTDCSLTVQRGDVVVICGPSGSGKSTFVKCINGIEAFQAGHVTIDGEALATKGREATRLRARVGMVFQHFELYPHLSVLDNICLAPVHVLKRNREEAVVKAQDLLQRVGLLDKQQSYDRKS